MKKYLIAYLNSALNNKVETTVYFEVGMPIDSDGLFNVAEIEKEIRLNKDYVTAITVFSISPLFKTQ